MLAWIFLVWDWPFLVAIAIYCTWKIRVMDGSQLF